MNLRKGTRIPACIRTCSRQLKTLARELERTKKKIVKIVKKKYISIWYLEFGSSYYYRLVYWYIFCHFGFFLTEWERVRDNFSYNNFLTYDVLSSHLWVLLNALGTLYLLGHWFTSIFFMSIDTATAPLHKQQYWRFLKFLKILKIFEASEWNGNLYINPRPLPFCPWKVYHCHGSHTKLIPRFPGLFFHSCIQFFYPYSYDIRFF